MKFVQKRQPRPPQLPPPRGTARATCFMKSFTRGIDCKKKIKEAKALYHMTVAFVFFSMGTGASTNRVDWSSSGLPPKILLEEKPNHILCVCKLLGSVNSVMRIT